MGTSWLQKAYLYTTWLRDCAQRIQKRIKGSGSKDPSEDEATMIEAHIICCAPCDIPDLGIYGLQRGEERWVSLLSAESSQDLRKEQGKGNIRVARKSRRVAKQLPRVTPPFVVASRPSSQPLQIAAPSAEPTVVEVPVEVPAQVDQDEIANKVRKELVGDLVPSLRQLIAEEVGKAISSQVSQEPSEKEAPAVGAAEIASVMESVLRKMGTGGASAPSAGPEDPLFIPNDLVNKDAKGKISIETAQSSGASDLDDAQELLRQMKKARKGKK